MTNQGGPGERRQRLRDDWIPGAVALAALFLALKFVFNIHFSDFGFGFWAAVVLTVALVYFTLQARNAGERMPRVV